MEKGIIICECTSVSLNIKAVQSRVTFLVDLTSALAMKTLKLVYSRSFGMNLQQTCRRSSFYVGWMRGTLVYQSRFLWKA